MAQIHLWIGLVLALYLIVLSLTGSMIVLRPQFHRWLTQPEIKVSVPLTGEALDSAASCLSRLARRIPAGAAQAAATLDRDVGT